LQKRTEIASPTWSDGTVWVDSDSRVGLTGVSKEVWEFMIGGHKICEKWIKNRKGRLLTEDVRTEYQAIVTAISESIKASEKIEQAIDDNGSWPGAFQTTLYR
jgi:hypothetical protein